MTFLSEILSSMGHFDEIGLGITLVLVMLFIRGGLIELPGHIARRIGGRTGRQNSL